MFVVTSLPPAIVFCVITMLGWGSWADTQKLAGKEKWRFELFYWDYAPVQDLSLRKGKYQFQPLCLFGTT